MKDYLDPENAKGMPDLSDSAIAMEFLITAKSGVHNLAIALTETVNPKLRAALRSQLEKAIDLHTEISELMIKNKWLHPHNVSEQYQVDMKSAKTAVDIAKLQLFPGDTDRLGMFATPKQ